MNGSQRSHFLQAVGNVQAREDWEVFYSSPSLTAQAFFAAVHSSAQRLPEEKWAAFSILAELSQAALVSAWLQGR